MLINYVYLALLALVPVVLSIGFFLLDKYTRFKEWNYWLKQAIIGVMFGGAAILGTEVGIPISGAQINCRDAAVLSAGLLFGGPAGIIAGTIGALERFVSVYWGIGEFTRIACSIATFAAGFYALLLRKVMFEGKRPNFIRMFFFGVVMEVFHMTMVVLTHMGEVDKALQVIVNCTIPLILANSISAMLAALAVQLLSKEKIIVPREVQTISQTIQKWLLLTVVVAFILTSGYVFALQNSMAISQRDKYLNNAITETKADVKDMIDANIFEFMDEKQIVYWANEGIGVIGIYVKHTDLSEKIAELNFVGNGEGGKEWGIIFESNLTDPPPEGNIGFDMNSGDQSREFLVLLDGKTKTFAQDYGPISRDPSIKRKYVGQVTNFGFVQIGLDEEQFHALFATDVKGVTKNRHVGETGYILILDQHYQVVSQPVGMQKTDMTEFMKQLTEKNKPLNVELDGESVFAEYEEVEGYYIVPIYPTLEAFTSRDMAIYANTYMEVLAFALLFFLVYVLIKFIIVKNLKKVNASLGKITSGDLNEVVSVNTNEEFVSLTNDINSTVDTLKKYIEEAKNRISAELEFAKNIQSSALPSSFPRRPEFDIYAMTTPAKEIGGDFYDFYYTRRNVMNVLIADVSGKGIPAAMFMMRAKTELKSLTENELSLNEVFDKGNKGLCEGNDAGMFVTAWEGSIDLEDGKVKYVNAGHNPPIIKRKKGQFEYVKSRAGFVLAGIEGVNYKLSELKLQVGDILFLYTDGITEATNLNNELFGEQRLLDVLNEKEYDSMKELCDNVKEKVFEFVGEAPQFDDITMLAFKYNGSVHKPKIAFHDAKIDDINLVTEFVDSQLKKLDCSSKSLTQINIAIDEIYSNIVKFAYKDSKGPVKISLDASSREGFVSVSFEDSGEPYDPLKKADPDITLSAEEREIGGLGILMVKRTMDDVTYERIENKNVLTITKKLN